MKKLFFLVFVLAFTATLSAQPVFNVGVKAGLTNSKLSFKADDYKGDNVLKYHVGAFGRVGISRFFVQPEVYFSSRGGKIKGNTVAETVEKFDFTTIDVPVLVGISVIDQDLIKVRLMGGPLFDFVISKNSKSKSESFVDNLKDNFFGWQYGIGVDVWKATLDARFENSSSNVIKSSNGNAKMNTFVLSVGFKIL